MNVFFSCDDLDEFSASLLQPLVSHDLLEIILICWYGDYYMLKKHFLLLSMLKTVFAA